MVSATFSGEEAERITSELGANAFMSAPVDREKYLAQVRALLNGYKEKDFLRALIVDDSRSLCGLLKNDFEKHGYQVQIALNAKEAFTAFQRQVFDLAVIDYHLPDQSGDHLLDSFLKQQPDCVCIMITTDPHPKLALDWMKKGALASLRKPFQSEYLIKVCNKAKREKSLLRVENLLEQRTEELKYRLELENLVSDICQDFMRMSVDRLDMTINRSLEKIGSFMGVDRTYIYLMQENDKYLDNSHEWTAGPGLAQQKNMQGLPVAKFPWWIKRLKMQKVVHIPRVADLSVEARPEKEQLQSSQVLSVLAVPLFHQLRLLGFMGLDSVREERSWSQADIDMMNAVADAIASSLLRWQQERNMSRKSQEQCLLLDTIPNQVWYLTDVQTYGALNKAHAEFLGYKPQEIAYRKLYDFVSRSVAQECQAANKEVFEKSQTLIYQQWVSNTKGEQRLLNITKTPKLGDDDQVEYVVCSAEDITEQYITQQALHRSEAMFRNIVQHSPVGIELYDQDRKSVV